MHIRFRHSHGFSLVELSIVLVILGLLTGGILAGQSLIRAAELRSVSSEFNRYTAAMSTFRDKYFALPGDFTKASGTGGFGWTDAAGSAAVVGDGDGTVELSTTAASNESVGFWVHLADAALVEGNYTQAVATSASVCGTQTAGTNNPRSRMNNASWKALGIGVQTDSGNAVVYGGNYGNALLFGAGTGCGTATATTGTLKSEEAWNIDTKTDDGLPATGAVTSYESQGSATAGSGCGNLGTATTSLAASAYDLTNTSSTACSLIFKTGY